MASSAQVRALVLVAAIASVATACGPITIDVAPLPSAKPSGSATTGPGTQPSPGTTSYPSIAPTNRPTVAPSPGRTAGPNETPGPNDTPRPTETGVPTPSPVPTGANASATPPPNPGTSPTPVAWPSAEEIPGEPVQGKAYEVKRDAGKPMDVAVDAAGVAWVAIGKRTPGTDNSANKGEVVTLASDGKPLKIYTLEGNPTRIEAAKGGGVWVLMDARTNAGSAPSQGLIRLGSDGKLLSRIDLTATSGYGSDMTVMQPDPGGNVWVKMSAYNGQSLHRVGSGGGLLGTYTLTTSSGGSSGALGVDADSRALVADYSGKQIVRVGTNLVKDTSFPAAVDNYGAFNVQGSQDKIWVAFGTELQLWKADGSKVATTKTGYNVHELMADGSGGMWALGLTGSYQAYSGSVVHYDAQGTAEASYAVGPDPRGFGVGGDGAIWAANYDAGTVTRVGTR